MQRRGDDSMRAKIARARARATGRRQPVPARPPVRKRRVPRREIEARRQRLVRWGVAIAGALVLLLVFGGLAYENVIKPNQTLATVGTESITRQEYWKWRANDLFEQAQQYRDFAQFVGPDQQSQYLAFANQSLAQAPEVWGSTDVDSAALQSMVEGQIFVQGLDSLGLTMTPDEVETFALNRFSPPGAPLIPPSPTPTFTAERAAMATSTAQAFLATPFATPVAATPAAGTPVAGTPIVASSLAGTPGATPVAGMLEATPVAVVPTVLPATPNPVEARATAEAGFDEFATNFFAVAHLTREDYERLVAAPALARQKVADALAAEIGQSAPQVHAAHILLPTEEAARAARERIVADGEPFAAVAEEVSTDEATAGNGGDLGWFTRLEMVAPFAEAAFSLEPEAISEPVETEFGWHLIRVDEVDPDRPLTDSQINRLRQTAVDRWLDDERASLTISGDLAPTPTPFAPQFQPPIGAPPPPTPTPLPATPVGE
jgi:peptidyl-prolyl cis-trans isomerase C